MKVLLDLVGGLVVWSIVFLVGRFGEGVLFPTANSWRPPTLLEGAIVSAIAAAALMTVNHRASRFHASARLLVVISVLCVVQWTWLATIVPWWIASDERTELAARHAALVLLIEGAVPAFIGASTWLLFMRSASSRRRIAIIAASVVGCLITAWVVNPEVVRGSFEAAGWLELASPRHLSGAHTNPFLRHVAYIGVVATIGLLFYIASSRPPMEATSA